MTVVSSAHSSKKDLPRTALDLIDAIVEVYLKTTYTFFLKQVHHRFRNAARRIPKVSSDAITLLCSAACFVLLLLLAHNQRLLASLTVLMVAVVDVWHYDENTAEQETATQGSTTTATTTTTTPDSAIGDADSFGTYCRES